MTRRQFETAPFLWGCGCKSLPGDVLLGVAEWQSCPRCFAKDKAKGAASETLSIPVVADGHVLRCSLPRRRRR